MYRDHEFDPVSSGEHTRRGQEEEFARRVRREVRRMDRGETEGQELEEELPDAGEVAAERLRRRRARLRQGSTLWQLFTGTILLREGVSRYYPYMLCIAGMFFLSIVVLFWSLHLDLKYTRLERGVQLLRERSVRLEQRRYRLTTHSAIVGQLRARGIELYDPPAPGEVIEN